MNSKKDFSANQMRVPILLPTGKDGALVANVLGQQQIEVIACESMQDLLVHIGNDCGPFVVADEALSGEAVNQLIDALQNQPDWSSLPGFVLQGPHAGYNKITNHAKIRGLSLIQRPVRTTVFTNLIKTAIESRKRQFQVRDLLKVLIETNQKMRSRTDLLQKLSLELTRAENQERQRIAQILHDDLQSLLASGRLHSELLFEEIDPDSAAKVQILHDIFVEAMQASRKLSHDLNPAFIIGGNLEAALRKLMDKMAESYNFATKVTGKLVCERIVEEIQFFVYRSLQELLLNCYKHAEATCVSLELKHQGDTMELVVSDDGKGIEPEKLKIYGGNSGGFGLFSIQERVAALGGSFRIHGAPNKGCRIILNIPGDPKNALIAQAAVAPGQPHAQMLDRHNHSAEHGTTKTISVMIADDHAVVRQGLASLLQSRPGIDVIAEAADGEQAVFLALQFRPDVLLMDISMPLLNGIDATRKIKQQAPDVMIIGLSTFLDQSTQQQMIDAGAQVCLSKDVQAEVLLKKIQRPLS